MTKHETHQLRCDSVPGKMIGVGGRVIREARIISPGWLLLSKFIYLWSHGSEFELDAAVTPVRESRSGKVYGKE